MKKIKKVYQVRQNLYTDGHSIFSAQDLNGKNVEVLNLNQAPLGHPAHLINSILPKSKNRTEDVGLLKAMGTNNFKDI